LEDLTQILTNEITEARQKFARKSRKPTPTKLYILTLSYNQQRNNMIASANEWDARQKINTPNSEKAHQT